MVIATGPAWIGGRTTARWWWSFEGAPQMVVLQPLPVYQGVELRFIDASVTYDAVSTKRTTYRITVVNDGNYGVQYRLWAYFLTVTPSPPDMPWPW